MTLPLQKLWIKLLSKLPLTSGERNDGRVSVVLICTFAGMQVSCRTNGFFIGSHSTTRTNNLVCYSPNKMPASTRDLGDAPLGIILSMEEAPANLSIISATSWKRRAKAHCFTPVWCDGLWWSGRCLPWTQRLASCSEEYWSGSWFESHRSWLGPLKGPWTLESRWVKWERWEWVQMMVEVMVQVISDFDQSLSEPRRSAWPASAAKALLLSPYLRRLPWVTWAAWEQQSMGTKPRPSHDIPVWHVGLGELKEKIQREEGTHKLQQQLLQPGWVVSKCSQVDRLPASFRPQM